MTAASHRLRVIAGDTACVDAGFSPAAHVSSQSVSSLNSPPVSSPVVLFPGVYTVVTYEQAKRYARLVGIAAAFSGLDLKTLNAYRKQNGLFPFAVKAAP